jgi:formylmethanofuran dehydrogenase subunit D
MPTFKGTPAEVEAAPDRKILTMAELLKSEFGR